jgi:hypothetical protein
MIYCDENGCMNRQRHLVGDPIEMTNNKQQTAVEWFIEELEYKGDLRETPSIRNIQLNIDTSDYMELKVQAKEMGIAGKEMSYSDGYREGYKRAIENAKYQINKWIDKELKITQQ